jgi:serine/threonine-protein kinase HipA
VPLKISEIERLEVICNAIKVGDLTLTQDGLCAFQYDGSFIEKGFSISPFYLPLERKVFIGKQNPFNGNFGVFNDSLPDGWGGLLLDRYLKKNGIDVSRLNQLQKLAIIGFTGRGALEYIPNYGFTDESSISDLQLLANEAEKILETEYNGEGLDTFFKIGVSSGGARPKLFLKAENKEWLVKFKAASDSLNIGEIEYKYSLLAKKCEIEMPETQLFENKFFGVQRFDRMGNEKIHTISAAGLLHADYRIPSLDYETLLQASFILTKNMKEVEKLYRIMVFNVVIGNKDDHAKNFSFQYSQNQWKLSPAYDLLPSEGFNGNHTTTINGKGNPTNDDMLALAKKIGIKSKFAQNTIEQIISNVKESNI